jgi:hypothetical protein
MVDFVSLVLLHVGWGVTGSVFLVVLWGDMFCLLVLRWGWSWWSNLSWGGGDCDRFELGVVVRCRCCCSDHIFSGSWWRW